MIISGALTLKKKATVTVLWCHLKRLINSKIYSRAFLVTYLKKKYTFKSKITMKDQEHLKLKSINFICSVNGCLMIKKMGRRIVQNNPVGKSMW